MCNLKKSLVALIAVLTLYGVETRADSFTIPNVNGIVYVNTFMYDGRPILRLPPQFDLSGPGFNIRALSAYPFDGDPGNVEARDACQTMGCPAGTVLGTNNTFSGILRHGVRATVNGAYFDSVILNGSLDFVSQPIVLPNQPDDYYVTIPFTFSGEIEGVETGTSTPIFNATLSGQGFATFCFWNVSWPRTNALYVLYSIEYRFEPVYISIDIKPAAIPNRINPNSKGKIPVAILTTDTFDATAVDPATVLFGLTGVEVGPVQSAREDIDGDGDTDLVLHFMTQDTGISCLTTHAWLTAATFAGPKIKGMDAVNTVGCN